MGDSSSIAPYSRPRAPQHAAREESMPDLFEIIESCRAMRRLKPDPVPDELISKILRAGSCAPNGGNTQKWRFLVIKDPKIKKAVQVWYKKAFDEVIGPRYLTSEPPPGVTKERYLRQHAAVDYLTDTSTRRLCGSSPAWRMDPVPTGWPARRSIRRSRTWCWRHAPLGSAPH